MASDEVLIKIAADLSKLEPQFQEMGTLWEKHNKDVAAGEKAYKEFANSVVKENEKVNKKLKDNIGRINDEAKAVKNLDKTFTDLNKKNKDSFDPKNLNDFNNILEKVGRNMGGLEQLDLGIDDYDQLLKLVSQTENEFEALNVLVDFFEDKMKQSASSVSVSFDEIKGKIEETKLNIKSTEDFIKEINKRIEVTAPGQDQANLLSERKAAIEALNEEKIALSDYQSQLKKAREENVAMTTQLRKVKDELVRLEIAGETNTERYRKLTSEAEAYNEAIQSTNQQLRRQASATEGLDNLIGAVNGIVGVYSAAEGAQALFGAESEDLQKTLVKLNGAIALLNGLQAIQTELTKQETIAGRALAIVKSQYAVATDASAKATIRLGAALKLLGIGLLVGALAAVVTYWKDIAKFIGITSDETERLNAVQKNAIESSADEIGRLKALQIELINTNTPLERQKEIRKDLLEQYPNYLKVLDDEKASVDEIKKAFDRLNEAILVNAKISAARELISEEFKKVLEAERKAFQGEATTFQTSINFLKNSLKGGIGSFDSAGFISDQFGDANSNLDEIKSDFESFEDFISSIIGDLNQELSELGGDPTKDGDGLKDAQKAYENYFDVLRKLTQEQERYRIDAIENNREREKEILRKRLEDEKENYRKQIDELQISESKKAKLREEFNKLYNEQTGKAYEQLRKDLLDIDQKYNDEITRVQLRAQQAIDSVFKTQEEIDRLAIKEKYENIRQEILEQIENTNDFLKKNELRIQLTAVGNAENEELEDFDLDSNLNRVDREKQIAESILAIQQANSRDIVENKELEKLQLLVLEKSYLQEILNTYKDSFKSIADQDLFKELTEQLINSTDPEEIQSIAQKLRDAFGDDIAQEILNTVGALKQVGNEINDINENSGLGNLISDIAGWTSSLQGFGLKLAETLGLQGEAAQEFADFTANAINSVVDGLTALIDQEIQQRQDKINAIEESIKAVEAESDREKQLLEEGFANNFDARQRDIENLKQQKIKEEEELKKAQKKKEAIQKAENIANIAAQISNLITSATEITAAHSGIPFVGVALAIGFIASMFGAIASAKAQAQSIGQGQNFRKGLKEGPVNLHGPSHERDGFGVYNSETGQKVAEFEGGEKVYVLNASQDKKYSRVMDAMIEEERGGRKFKDSVIDIFSIPKMGKTILKVVERVNEKQIVATKNKSDVSDNVELLNELKAFNRAFKDEFTGHRKEREQTPKTWETKDYYFVKIGNTTQKYPKKDAS